MSKKKLKGKCPWCEERVHAKVVETHRFRRDICECPKCGDRILKCRNPGCSDYAAGDTTWNDEFCPPCGKEAAEIGVIVGKRAAVIAISIAADLALPGVGKAIRKYT